jgi:Spy/CpxP family protein refolding chaperone
MKSFAVALAIVFGLFLQSAVAQTENQQMSKDEMKAQVQANVKSELAKIAKELNLTAEQKDKIKSILTDEHEKIMSIREDYRGKMRDVLTPEQQTKWDKMKAERGMKTEKKSEMKSETKKDTK